MNLLSWPSWTSDQAATVQAIALIVGLIVAIGVPAWQQWQARKERRAAKRQEDFAAAVSVTMKIRKMESYFAQIQRAIEGPLSTAAAGREPWEVVRSFINIPSEATFTEKETVFLVSTPEQLFQPVLELPDRYYDFRNLVASYSVLRQELVASIPADVTESNQAVPASLDGTQNRRRRQLNGLIDAMKRNAAENSFQAGQTFNRFHAYCAKRIDKFPKNLNLQLAPDGRLLWGETRHPHVPADLPDAAQWRPWSQLKAWACGRPRFPN